MAERRLPLIFAGAGLLLLLVLGLQLEVEEVIYDGGPDASIQGNPYLAATRFLEHSGIRVELANGMAATEVLPDLDTLLVLAAGGTLSERRSQQVLAWVEQGGHLLLEARLARQEGLGTAANPLLDALGVQVTFTEVPLLGLMDDATQEAVMDAAWQSGRQKQGVDGQRRATLESCAVPDPDVSGKTSGQRCWKEPMVQAPVADTPAPAADAGSGANPGGRWQQSLLACGADEQPSYTLVTGAAQKYPLTADLGWMPLLELADKQAPEPWLFGSNALGGKLLGIRRGAGTVVVVSSFRQWRNPRMVMDRSPGPLSLVPAGIGCLDHAHLLRVLVGNARRVLLVHDLDMPHVVAQLLRAIPLVLSTLGLLLGLWLVRQLVRPAPIRPGGNAERRSLQEYVDAGSAFLWRSRDSKGLLAPLQDDVRMHLRRRWPALAQDERCAAAAAVAGCEAGQLVMALAPDDHLNELQLLQHTRVLELVRQACANRQHSEDTST